MSRIPIKNESIRYAELKPYLVVIRLDIGYVVIFWFNNLVKQNRMKIFKTVRKKYAIVGIRPSNRLIQRYSFNEREFIGFFILGCTAASYFMYIFREARGFIEYMESICAFSASIIMFVSFASVSIKKAALFTSIDKIEKLIETSKIFVVYYLLNE